MDEHFPCLVRSISLLKNAEIPAFEMIYMTGSISIRFGEILERADRQMELSCRVGMRGIKRLHIVCEQPGQRQLLPADSFDDAFRDLTYQPGK